MFIASSVGSGPSVPALWGKVFSYSLGMNLPGYSYMRIALKQYFYCSGITRQDLGVGQGVT